jgi:hypothetical protein
MYIFLSFILIVYWWQIFEADYLCELIIKPTFNR